MSRRQAFAWSGIFLALILPLAVAACAPAPAPTAAPPEATAAPPTAPTAPVQPVATTAVVAPTVAVMQELKYRPIPILKTPPPNPKAKHGGIYRRLSTADPPDFGIWDSASGLTMSVAVPVYDSLLNRNEFEPNKLKEILPSMAYDWWTNEAGTQWTFKLREGITFADDMEVTCADAKFSLDTIRLGRDVTGDELRRSPRGAWLSRVTEIRCPDSHTVEIVTEGPLPSLPATLAVSSFAILPKHIFEGKLNLLETQLGPGQGPYMFDSYIPTEFWKLKRNPNYWEQPYPYLDGLLWINVGSTAASQAAFRVLRAEEGSLPPDVRERAAKEGKVKVFSGGATHGFSALHVNWARKPYNDRRFGMALRCAINSAQMIATAFDGQGFEGPIFPLADTPGGSEWAITKEEWKAVHPCHGPTAETDMKQRQEIARQLLAELGFGPNNPARPQVVWGGDPVSASIWSVIDDNIRPLGILGQVQFAVTDVRYALMTSGDFDLGNPVSQGFVTSRLDPDHWLYEHYFSTSDRNYGRYVNAEVDALINQQSRALDKAERYKLLNQIEKILLRDNAKIVYNHGLFQQTLAPWVQDLYPGHPSNGQNTATKFLRTWIDPDVKKAMGY